VLREAVVVALLAAACEQRKAAPTSEPATATPTTSEPTELGLGAAVVHLPNALAPNEKVPLVIVLHGLGATAAAIEQNPDFRSFAEEKRIAWVAPDGPKDKHGRQFWNAGPTCCNFDAIAVDHVSALRSLITRATATHPLDSKRVFVVGYSNGGFMAHRLGCELAGIVAGIASVAGAGTKADEPCSPEGPLRVLQVQGDADPIVNIAGGPLFADTSYPSSVSASQTVGDWAKRLGCKPKPTAAGTLDFEAKLPGAETTVTRFDGCRRGAVELWTVVGGGHFVGLRRSSYEAMWKFLSAS
jgi:polyhydroxybutyrate depolymerase